MWPKCMRHTSTPPPTSAAPFIFLDVERINLIFTIPVILKHCYSILVDKNITSHIQVSVARLSNSGVLSVFLRLPIEVPGPVVLYSELMIIERAAGVKLIPA